MAYKKREEIKKKSAEQPLHTQMPKTYSVSKYERILNSGSLGEIAGTLLFRKIKSTIDWALPLSEKVAACNGRLSFPWIHQLKQFELKHCALASTAIPLTISLYDAYQSEPKELSRIEKIENVAKKQFSFQGLLYYSSMIALAFATPLYRKELGLSSENGFHASEYIMLKTVLASTVGASLSQADQTRPNFAFNYAVAYSVTDRLFLGNMINVCHTGKESVYGYLWGFGILTISHMFANTVVKISNHW